MSATPPQYYLPRPGFIYPKFFSTVTLFCLQYFPAVNLETKLLNTNGKGGDRRCKKIQEQLIRMTEHGKR